MRLRIEHKAMIPPSTIFKRRVYLGMGLIAVMGLWLGRRTLTEWLYRMDNHRVARLEARQAKEGHERDSRYSLKVLDQIFPIGSVCNRGAHDAPCEGSLSPQSVSRVALSVLLSRIAHENNLQLTAKERHRVDAYIHLDPLLPPSQPDEEYRRYERWKVMKHLWAKRGGGGILEPFHGEFMPEQELRSLFKSALERGDITWSGPYQYTGEFTLPGRCPVGLAVARYYFNREIPIYLNPEAQNAWMKRVKGEFHCLTDTEGISDD